jgi:DNA-binding response OmpR family regulator
MNGEMVPVPQCAFDFLVVLLRHSGQPVSYRQMVEEAHKNRLGALEAQDLARVNIYLLRKIIEENPQQPRFIRAVDGFGYRLDIH